MTAEPYVPLARRRRMTGLDWSVLGLTIAALALPIGLRTMERPALAGPQIAVEGEVSAIRPIDVALGLREEKAEAAFFDAQTDSAPAIADTHSVLDLALAAPEIPAPTAPAPALAPAASRIEGPSPRADVHPEITPDRAPLVTAEFLDADDPMPWTAPTPAALPDTEVTATAGAEQAVATAPLSPAAPNPPVLADLAPQSPEPVATVPVAPAPAEPLPALVRVRMTAPPTMTPMPMVRPRPRRDDPVALAALDSSAPGGFGDPSANIALPSAPTAQRIEEEPLPPIQTNALPVVVAMAAPAQLQPTVNDAAPEIIAPAAAAPAVAPAPAEPKIANGPKITNGPRIALVITAAGLNANVTRFAIESLPEGITLAFAPVKPIARDLAREAKEDGHAVLVEIPMEPINRKRDPGPLTLRAADSPTQNLARLEKALARIPFADGASSYLGARFNAVEGAAAPVIDELAKRDLVFFENEPTSRSVLRRLALRSNLPYAQGPVKIDRDKSIASVRAQLDALEKEARAKGSAVGVGTALRSTISAVALWAKEAEKRGVRFVPITAIAR